MRRDSSFREWRRQQQVQQTKQHHVDSLADSSGSTRSDDEISIASSGASSMRSSTRRKPVLPARPTTRNLGGTVTPEHLAARRRRQADDSSESPSPALEATTRLGSGERPPTGGSQDIVVLMTPEGSLVSRSADSSGEATDQATQRFRRNSIARVLEVASDAANCRCAMCGSCGTMPRWAPERLAQVGENEKHAELQRMEDIRKHLDDNRQRLERERRRLVADRYGHEASLAESIKIPTPRAAQNHQYSPRATHERFDALRSPTPVDSITQKQQVISSPNDRVEVLKVETTLVELLDDNETLSDISPERTAPANEDENSGPNRDMRSSSPGFQSVPNFGGNAELDPPADMDLGGNRRAESSALPLEDKNQSATTATLSNEEERAKASEESLASEALCSQLSYLGNHENAIETGSAKAGRKESLHEVDGDVFLVAESNSAETCELKNASSPAEENAVEHRDKEETGVEELNKPFKTSKQENPESGSGSTIAEPEPEIGADIKNEHTIENLAAANENTNLEEGVSPSIVNSENTDGRGDDEEDKPTMSERGDEVGLSEKNGSDTSSGSPRADDDVDMDALRFSQWLADMEQKEIALRETSPTRSADELDLFGADLEQSPMPKGPVGRDCRTCHHLQDRVAELDMQLMVLHAELDWQKSISKGRGTEESKASKKKGWKIPGLRSSKSTDSKKKLTQELDKLKVTSEYLLRQLQTMSDTPSQSA